MSEPAPGGPGDDAPGSRCARVLMAAAAAATAVKAQKMALGELRGAGEPADGPAFATAVAELQALEGECRRLRIAENTACRQRSGGLAGVGAAAVEAEADPTYPAPAALPLDEDGFVVAFTVLPRAGATASEGGEAPACRDAGAAAAGAGAAAFFREWGFVVFEQVLC